MRSSKLTVKIYYKPHYRNLGKITNLLVFAEGLFYFFSEKEGFLKIM
jgi:hypothetical protein